MAWDAELADDMAKGFHKDLQSLVEMCKDRNTCSQEGIDTLYNLQALWQKYFMQTGHKRLARVFLKEVFE